MKERSSVHGELTLDNMPSASWTEPTKNDTTFAMQVKTGVDPRMIDVQNLTFTDPMFPGQETQDVTFNQLTDVVWTEQNKNDTTFTFQAK
jgi:hypothetical protein